MFTMVFKVKQFQVELESNLDLNSDLNLLSLSKPRLAKFKPDLASLQYSINKDTRDL